MNTGTVGSDEKIPVIVCSADGKFYVSTSTTATRKKDNQTYVAIAKQVTANPDVITNVISSKVKECKTLQEAYDEYAKYLKNNYPSYTDTLSVS